MSVIAVATLGIPLTTYAQDAEPVRLEPAPLQSMDSLGQLQRVKTLKKLCGRGTAKAAADFSKKLRAIEDGRGSTREIETVVNELEASARSQVATATPQTKEAAEKRQAAITALKGRIATDLDRGAKERALRQEILTEANAHEQSLVLAAAQDFPDADADAAARDPSRACDKACKNDLARECLDLDAAEAKTIGSRAGALGPAALLGTGWESAVVKGIASFATERAEAEVVQWFAEEFQEKLCETKNGQQIFEETCTLLPKLKTGTQAAPSSLLASAIRADLEQIPLRLAGSRVGLQREDIQLLGQLFRKIRQGESPLSLLAGLATDERLSALCQSDNSSPSCRLFLVGQLVTLLGDGAQLSATKFENELPRVLDAYEQLRKNSKELCGAALSEKGSTKTRPLTPATHPAATAFCAVVRLPEPLSREQMADLLRLANALRAAQASTVGAEGPLPKAATVLALTVRLFRVSVQATKTQGWTRLFDALEAASEMSLGNYADGLRRVVVLLQCETESGDAVTAAGQNFAQELCLEPQLVRYAGLIVDLASAKTAEDVRSALDAAAAPVGSWRSKRVNVVFSLGAIVGASGGAEVPLDTNREVTGTAGAMLPIGIDLSGPIGAGFTLGAFFSVIDVGQLATFSIGGAEGSTETESVGSLEVVQVLSPGLYPHIGLGETPFLLGVGASLAPRLREDPSSDDEKATLIRFTGFLAVDVTLLPF